MAKNSHLRFETRHDINERCCLFSLFDTFRLSVLGAKHCGRFVAVFSCVRNCPIEKKNVGFICRNSI